MASINALDSPELKTIKKCTPQLETALKGCGRNLVHFLEGEGFISEDDHDKILDPKSMLTEVERAGELVRWIRKRVAQDPASFQVLLCHLKQCGTLYEPITKTLEIEYQKAASSVAAAPVTGSRSSPSKATSKDSNQPDLSSLEPGVLKDLKFQLEENCEGIIKRYNSYANFVQTSINHQQVTVEELCGFLMGLSAFSHGEQSRVLLSDRKFEQAKDVNEIFRILHREYSSFLNFGIFKTLQEKFVPDKGQEELRYPEHLKAYVDKHKIDEFLEVKPPLGKPTTTSTVMTLRFDIELTSRLAKLKDLERCVAKILNINPSGLRLLDVESGSVLVTFLLVNSIACVIFTGEKSEIFTQEQIKQFQDIRVQWLKCNDYEWNFSEYHQSNSPDAIVDASITSLFHSAAKSGDVDKVRELAEGGEYDVNCRDSEGQTPLHYACKEGHLDTVRALVSEVGATTNPQDINCSTPLHVAALYGKEDIALALINEFKCDPDEKGRLGRSLLHYACEGGNVSLVKTLILQFKADVHARDEQNCTPLDVAAHEEVVLINNDPVPDERVNRHYIGLGGNNIISNALMTQDGNSSEILRAAYIPAEIVQFVDITKPMMDITNEYNIPMVDTTNEYIPIVDTTNVAIDTINIQMCACNMVLAF